MLKRNNKGQARVGLLLRGVECCARVVGGSREVEDGAQVDLARDGVSETSAHGKLRGAGEEELARAAVEDGAARVAQECADPVADKGGRVDGESDE